MNTTHRRSKDQRICNELSPVQEDALVGLMFDEFSRNNCKHLDYDKVRRFAFELQTDPVICASMEAEPLGEGECWTPSDEFITEMCRAFLAHAKEQAQERSKGAFGGGREVDYDPKNPHARSPGSASKPRPYSRGKSTNRSKSPAARATARTARGSPQRPGSAASSSPNGRFDMAPMQQMLPQVS